MTAPPSPRWSRLPWGSAESLRPRDYAVLGVAGVYAFLALTRLGGTAWAVSLNTWLYSAMALGTIWQFARVARLSSGDAEQLGWTLLTLSTLARFVSGTVWDALGIAELSGQDPAWMLPLGLSYLAFGLPALVLFPLSRWRGRDAERARIDGLTVVIGSFLVSWYFGIGPLLRSPEAATAPLDDRIMVFGDAIAVLFAARLHLRATASSTRAAARWLLIGLTLRLAPDLIIWRAPDAAAFEAYGLIDAAWFSVWALHWCAARTAETMRAQESPADGLPQGRYISGLVPHGFLLAAIGALLVQLMSGESHDVALFTIGSAVLALLLVTRQGIELDERDLLAARLERERARFEALLRHAYDAVVMFARDGQLRYVSPSTVRTFGPELLAGTADSLVQLVHPEDRPRLLEAIKAPTASGATDAAPVALRLRARDQTGRWRNFEGHLHDHRADPLVDAIVLNGVDRTREARLAEGLAEAQPLEALGVLAGGLAHDLNNILMVVASHAELLDADAQLDARGREDVRAIRAASDRAQALTRGLLTLSRRKQGPAAAIAVPSAVRDALSGFPLASHAAFPPYPVSVLADPSALSQIIEGLFEGARSDAAHGAFWIAVDQREVEESEAAALGVESRLFASIAAGETLEVGLPVVREEAVRMDAGEEWDLAPGDLALLIALAACRELGGTLLRERQGARARYVALLPAVLQ